LGLKGNVNNNDLLIGQVFFAPSIACKMQMESQGCMDWYITLTLVRDFGSHATSFTLMIVDSEDQEA